MRRRRRPRDERFDPAQARRAYRNRDALDKPLCVRDPALKLKAQHAAKTVEQFARSQMIGMRLESGIIHASYARMRFEKTRDSQCALVLMTHAHGERLEPAIQEKARVRIERAAKVILRALDFANQVAASDRGARNDIRVTVQIFCRAVQRQIEADFRRSKINRTRESVVDDRYD